MADDEENQDQGVIVARTRGPAAQNLVSHQLEKLRRKDTQLEGDDTDLADSVIEQLGLIKDKFESIEGRLDSNQTDITTLKGKTKSIEKELIILENVTYNQLEHFFESHEAKSINYNLNKARQIFQDENGRKIGINDFNINTRYVLETVLLKDYKVEVSEELNMVAIVYQVMDGSSERLFNLNSGEPIDGLKIAVSGRVLYNGKDSRIIIEKPAFKEKVIDEIKEYRKKAEEKRRQEAGEEAQLPPVVQSEIDERAYMSFYLNLENIVVFQEGFGPKETEKLKESLGRLTYTKKEEPTEGAN